MPWRLGFRDPLGGVRGGLLEKGLIREGSLLKILDEKDVCDRFISLLPHML